MAAAATGRLGGGAVATAAHAGDATAVQSSESSATSAHRPAARSAEGRRARSYDTFVCREKCRRTAMTSSVYFRAMEMNRQTLSQRIFSTLRAKQQLVLFAIVLGTLDFCVPLFGAWLQRPRPLADLIAHSTSPLYLLRAPSFGVVVLLAGYVALASWLRAGYIRSIIGTTHFSPQSGRQWASMAGLLVVTFGLSVATDVGLAGTSDAGSLTLVQVFELAVTFVLLYADYAIVIGGLDPMTAIRRSLTTASRTLFASLSVMLFFTLVGQLLSWLIDQRLTGSLIDMLLLLATRLIAFGGLAFVSDVALILIYIDAVERGVVPPGSGNVTGGGTMDVMR